jgi:hypothetical protein
MSRKVMTRYELWLQEKMRKHELWLQEQQRKQLRRSLRANAHKKDRLAWAEFQATRPDFLRIQKVLDRDEPGLTEVTSK